MENVLKTLDARKLKPTVDAETLITAKPAELSVESKTLELTSDNRIPWDTDVTRVMVNISDEELRLLGDHLARLPYNAEEPYAHWHFVGRTVSQSLFDTAGELMLVTARRRDDEDGEILGFLADGGGNFDEGYSRTIYVSFCREALAYAPVLKCELA